MLKEQLLPLTVAQRGLWIATQIAPRNSVFNLAELIEIGGPINASLFVDALHQVASEAETLRVSIVETPEGPRQLIRPAYPWDFPVLDVSDQSDPAAAAEDWMRAELTRPVDLAEDRLWSCALFRVAADRWFWYHRAHHIMLDGFGGGLIVRRVAEIYSSLVAGRELPPPRFGSLASLISADADYRSSGRIERDRAFWREYLAKLPPAMSLAKRRVPSGGGLLRRSATIDAEKARTLRKIAKSLGASPPQLLIAMVASYYQRATGATDLVIGMPVTGRASPALRAIPGMVANAVSLRLGVQPSMSFGALVMETGRALLRGLRHQQFRYEELRRELGLFGADQQVSWLGVNIEPFDYALDFAGHTASTRNLSNGTIEDLMIFIYDRSDDQGLRIDFDANPMLYTPEDLALHESRLTGLIDQIIEKPDRSIESLDLFAPGERRRVIEEWNSTEQPAPLLSIPATIAAAARRDPEAVAIVDRTEDGDVLNFSYDWLIQQSDSVTAALHGIGIGPGHLVAILLPRSALLPAALVGVMGSGAAYLPIDPELPRARIEAILGDASPTAVLAAPEAIETISGILTSVRTNNSDRIGFAPVLHSPAQPDVEGREAALHGANGSTSAGEPALFSLDLETGIQQTRRGPGRLPGPVLDTGVAYVIFTSGSTGRPKGVMVTKTGLANVCAAFWSRLDMTPADRLIAVTTIGFDIAALEMFLPLLAGGAMVLADRRTVQSPAELARWLTSQGVTVMQATPSLYQLMVKDRSNAAAALDGLTLIVGGETLPPPLAASLHRRARRLFNVYGPTETTIWSTLHEMSEADCAAPPIGIPIDNTRVYVLDQNDQPVPPCISGYLWIGGDGVALGYLNRPELTAEKFVEEPVFLSNRRPGSRMFRTGDLARFDQQGRLEFLGRGDSQVKIRGFRVELGEVEAAMAAVPGVAAAAAALRSPMVRPGQLETPHPQLIGYIVPRPDHASPDPSVLRGALKEVLPDYMIPSSFMTLSDLPMTMNGKVDRAALPTPETALRATAGENYVAPRTKGEKLLAGLWKETFKLDRVSIHDNFFALGGDSLSAVNLVAELSGRYSIELPISALFQDPTIANLARSIDGAEIPDMFGTILPLRQGNGTPALFCVHPVAGMSWGYAGLTRYLSPGQSIYGLQSIGLVDAMPLSIEAMAVRYVEEMRKVQPHGPYMLVGWSLGGLVAHEIASHLCRNGEEVRLLGMLDSYPFRVSETMDEADVVAASLGFLGYSPERLNGAHGINALADLLTEEYALNDIPLPPGLSSDELVKKVRSVTELSLAMAQRFRPKHVPHDLLFVRAAHRPAGAAGKFLDDRPDVWADHMGGKVIVHEIACRHQDMLDPEPLREISGILAEAIA
jgi:enterobactin synthetase component F